MPGGMRTWTWISRVGRLPRLWLGCAVALGLSGGAGRRAARDGLVAAVLTDRLVSWVLKPLFGRSRPARGAAPPDMPGDASLPSAHAANGFAFATVVSRSVPSSTGSLYLAASAVAVSRVALGFHHVSDVVAGAALGYAIGTRFGREH